MTKLIILQGLPASGKSSLCEKLLRIHGGVRINRDLLRTMLHFDVWNPQNESITRNLALAMTKDLLTSPKVSMVIIDETNLQPQTLNGWKQLAEMCQASWEVIDLPTPVEECVRRDALREKPVGSHVIVGMALQSHRYPMPEHGIVLCDIDGTVADCSHRRHFLKEDPKDWNGFFAGMHMDDVIGEVAVQLDKRHFEDGQQLFFISGRPERYRTVTEKWLKDVRLDYYTALFMRRPEDHRPDTVVKQEMLDRYFPEPYRAQIQCVYDDRPSVIRDVWKKAGLPVIDRGTGEEF